MGQVIKLGKINETNDGVRIPLYMYGHSSGGLGAILYHQFRLSYDLVPVDGIVATAPYLRLTKDLPEWQKGMINILNKIDSSYMVTASFDVQHLTSDVKFQEKYKSDPLRNSDISAKQLKIWSDAGAIAMYDTAKFTCPILIIHGDKDTVTDYRSSECFIQTCNSKDKKFILAKGFLHDLHTETGRVHIFRKVMQWINARVGSPKVTLTVNSNAGERRRSRAVIDRPPVLNEIIDKVKKEESQTFNDHHVNSVQLETRVTPEVSINIPERSTTFLVETD
jgi:alpha-beta hydrolase superfamily lysophospholipase